MGWDSRYLRAIELFNSRRFFEAHEAWESLWHEAEGPNADFLKGLIQSAVALHHFSRGNLKGAKYMYIHCCRLLDRFGAKTMGLDVRAFLSDLRECFKELEPYSEEELPGSLSPKEDFPVRLDPARIPTIKLEA